jgi:hypothetical protein
MQSLSNMPGYKSSFKAYKNTTCQVDELLLRKQHAERFFDGNYDEGHAWWMLKLSADKHPLCRIHKRRLEASLGVKTRKRPIPLELLTSGRLLKVVRKSSKQFIESTP